MSIEWLVCFVVAMFFIYNFNNFVMELVMAYRQRTMLLAERLKFEISEAKTKWEFRKWTNCPYFSIASRFDKFKPNTYV